MLITFILATLQLEAKQIALEKVQWHKVGTWEISKKEPVQLSMVHRKGSAFNLCYTQKFNLKNLSLSVQFHANKGRIDQGGGLMWRVQDDDNYYVARFNPLEDNFRFYILDDGMRIELASANLHLCDGWHTMKIVQDEDKFQGFIDGKLYLSKTNSSLQKSGGIGLWTKADAETTFKNFTVQAK